MKPLHREAEKTLGAWQGKHKVLVLTGARQVGKTWLMNEFGKTEFKQTVYLNFESSERLQQLFASDFNIQRIISVIEIESRQTISPSDTLLIFDEIQAGFGRTGSLWAFSAIGVIPDVLLLGKALGGGMPLGAFITDKKWMDLLTDRPVLGHITTFGGHPVCCAAGLAAFEALLDENWIEQVHEKERLLLKALLHSKIVSVRSAGLWMGVEFENATACKKVIDYVLERGVLTDWFLFAPHCLRISPPLIIHSEQLKKAAALIVEACDVVL